MLKAQGINNGTKIRVINLYQLLEQWANKQCFPFYNHLNLLEQQGSVIRVR